jgi:hypothetical protein
LTASSDFLTFTPRFRFAPRRTRLVTARCVGAWSLFTAAGTARPLGSWAARANAGSHAGLAADATEQSGLGLFDDFDFSVIAVNTEVSEGTIGCLFD